MQVTLYVNCTFQNQGAIYSYKLDIASDLDFLTKLLRLDNDDNRTAIIIKMINSRRNVCFAAFDSLTSEPKEEGWDNLGDDARCDDLTLLDAFIADPAEHIGDWNELIERQAAKDKTADENHMAWEKASIFTDAIALIREWDNPVKFKTHFELNSKNKHLSTATLLKLLEAWAIHEDFQWLVKSEYEKLVKHNLSLTAVYGLTDKLLHIRIGRSDKYGFQFEPVTDVFTPMGVIIDVMCAVPESVLEREAIKNAVSSLIAHCHSTKNKPWLVDVLSSAKAEAKSNDIYK